MKNLLLFAFLAFSLTGMLTPSLVSDSFAGTENPGRDQGKKLANGCEKGKQPKNNPNCDPETEECPTGQHRDESGNCVPDVEPFTACDTNGDGVIDLAELDAAVGADKDTMAFIEGVDPLDDNGVIDTQTELNTLNAFFGNHCS